MRDYYGKDCFSDYPVPRPVPACRGSRDLSQTAVDLSQFAVDHPILLALASVVSIRSLWFSAGVPGPYLFFERDHRLVSAVDRAAAIGQGAERPALSQRQPPDCWPGEPAVI